MSDAESPRSSRVNEEDEMKTDDVEMKDEAKSVDDSSRGPGNISSSDDEGGPNREKDDDDEVPVEPSDTVQTDDKREDEDAAMDDDEEEKPDHGDNLSDEESRADVIDSDDESIPKVPTTQESDKKEEDKNELKDSISDDEKDKEAPKVDLQPKNKKKLPKVENEVDDEETDERVCTSNVRVATEYGTLNAMITPENLFTSYPVCDYDLLAASRLNVGINAGRYLFEVELLLTIEPISANDIKIGFSRDDSTIYLGDTGSFGYSATGEIINGNPVNTRTQPVKIGKGSVIGLLLNLTEKGNSKTFSLFHNGQRIGEPQPIPVDCFGEPVYPHIQIKNATILVNTNARPYAKYPFKCRMIGAPLQSECVIFEKELEQEIVVPYGSALNENYIELYKKFRPNEHFEVCSLETFNAWLQKSGCPSLDAAPNNLVLKCLEKMMHIRKQRYLYGFNSTLDKKNRRRMATIGSGTANITMLVLDEILPELPKQHKMYKLVSMPTDEEGFTNIIYSQSKECSTDIFDEIVKKVRSESKIEELKPGQFYNDECTKWNKLVDVTRDRAEKKRKGELNPIVKEEDLTPEQIQEKQVESILKKQAEAEGKSVKDGLEGITEFIDTMEWAEEDWMLAELRAEIHIMLHSFKLDLSRWHKETEPEDWNMHIDNVEFYYELYGSGRRKFSPGKYGLQGTIALLQSISDIVTIQTNESFVQPILEQDVDLNDILRIVETARQDRILRVSAGESQFRLKFTAPPGIRELQKIQQQLEEIQRAKLLKKKEEEINEKKKKKQQNKLNNQMKGKGKGQNQHQKGKGKGGKMNIGDNNAHNISNPMRMIPLNSNQHIPQNLKRDRPWDNDNDLMPQQKKGKGMNFHHNMHHNQIQQNPNMNNFNWQPPIVNLEPRQPGPPGQGFNPNQMQKNNNNPNFQQNRQPKKKWNNNNNNRKPNQRDNPNHMPIL